MKCCPSGEDLRVHTPTRGAKMVRAQLSRVAFPPETRWIQVGLILFAASGCCRPLAAAADCPWGIRGEV
jgi:hypothetical protein